MNVVCLVVDRWHIGYVGCFGNAWVGTPALDRLACESFCCDQALTDSPRLEDVYRSLWKGAHASMADETVAAWPSLLQVAARAGIKTTLLTDEPAVAKHPLAADFAQRSLLELPDLESAAEEIDETRLGRFFAAASDWLTEAAGPFLLWLHSTGLGSAWDAPLELRNQYVEENDPPPPETCDVPCRELPADFDPDELLGIRRAYAGQAVALDMCIGALDALLTERNLKQQTLLAIISPRGLPLGEHRVIGPIGSALRAEIVHVPWLLRFPDGAGGGARAQSLVQPGDLMPTILQACGLPEVPGLAGRSLMPLVHGESERLRDRALVIGPDGERAIRTPAWWMRREPADGKVELYAKPDDRWEINEVSERCPEVVESLRVELANLERAHQSEQAAVLQPLDDMLLHGPV